MLLFTGGFAATDTHTQHTPTHSRFLVDDVFRANNISPRRRCNYTLRFSRVYNVCFARHNNNNNSHPHAQHPLFAVQLVINAAAAVAAVLCVQHNDDIINMV